MKVGNVIKSPVFRALIALVAVVAIGCVKNAEGTFFQWNTHRDMLRYVSEFGILACGMTIVIITGGIDLSVGSVLGLCAVLFSICTLHLQWPVWIAVLACMAAGGVAGSISGGLIAKFKMQPFIATLAMMVFARGVAKYVSKGQKISNYVQDADGNFKNVAMPDIFNWFNNPILRENIGIITLVFIVCLLLCWVLLAWMRWGRYLYAIGGNEEATRLSGAPVMGTKILAYALAGVFSGIAGISHALQELQGDPEAGSGYELSAIAMVVIGGTSLNGGRGSIWLTLIGALTIGYLEKILSINAVQESGRLMLTGAIIVGAVLFQKTRR